MATQNSVFKKPASHIFVTTADMLGLRLAVCYWNSKLLPFYCTADVQ